MDSIIQINDTHYHQPLKANYRKLEQKLMIEKLRSDPEKKIPSPDRDELMAMATDAFKNISVDNVNAFKSLFITNALDGSEDYKVSDKIWKLVGNEMKIFRDKLMKTTSPKSLDELLKKITPPKGVKRKNVEGMQ